MADWSQMLEELIRPIARRLDTQFDVLRFRSVCSSWRSSVAPSPNPFPNGRFPIRPDNSTWVDFLCKRTIYVLGAPRSGDRTVPSGWLLKVAEDVPGRMRLLNPLSSVEFDLPKDFPRVLDLMNLRVLELGHMYVLKVKYDHVDDMMDADKVAFLCLDNENDFVLLVIDSDRKLAMFKSRERRWSNVQDMPLPLASRYHDVILFKGEFYAVDKDGWTVVVGLDLSVTLIKQLYFHNSEKFLVESVGELLLVFKYLSHDTENVHDGMVAELADNLDYLIRERTLRCKVYKLDREKEVWNEVIDLGDRVLFLGDECTFSASAADLGACKGNCIFFVDPDGGLEGLSFPIVVYDMESGIFVPIEDDADYSQLIWPPPDWIASRTSEPQV